jgi:hypothetical protein
MAGSERSIPEVFPQRVPAARPNIGSVHKTQTGTAQIRFLQVVIIAMLSLAVGLAIGAAVCMTRHKGGGPR